MFYVRIFVYMPTTYTHWRFGQECLETLPKKTREIVNNHRDIYDIGVHGPDIFFYDLLHDDVKSYGYTLHGFSGKEFFEHAIEVYKEYPDKEEMLAYMLGFLSHYTFDSQSHGYVERKMEVSGITHNKVESEYDGYLMRKDGRAVNLVDRSESLKPSREAARIISRFYPFDEAVMYRVFRAHKSFISAMNCMSPFKFKVVTKLLDLTGKDGNRDIPVAFEESEICRDSNLRMEKLQAKALELYPTLYKSLMAAIRKQQKLSRYFDHDFGPWKNYQKIPVLSYEKELKYKV